MGGEVTARDVIIATGSVPFVPPGIPIDGKTVFTSDHALKLEWIPSWIAIIGSGYIGLEFSDVYTALGSEVTFIEARPTLPYPRSQAPETVWVAVKYRLVLTVQSKTCRIQRGAPGCRRLNLPGWP